MKNLKLLGKLQAAEMVTLLLKATPGERLDYYILAKSINYSLVASGQCDGSIQGGMRMFNILLSGLLPMIDKGHSFRIQYEENVLSFVSNDERLRLTPLCVEYNDPNAYRTIEKLMRFNEALQTDEENSTQIAKVEAEIRDLQQQYNGVSLMHLSAEMTSSNPFGEDTGSQIIEDRFAPLIEEKRDRLRELKKRSNPVQPMNLKTFRTLAVAAARSREMISFCETYAILALGNTYLLQKGDCPVMAVQGSLLHQLISFSDGEGFYWFENGLVYSVGGAERTTVFMEKYLPNTVVDNSIVTRGTVKEKYTLSMKGILSITQLMKSKFPQMTFDMGDGKVILENDKGEVITTKFDVEDAQTLKLKKLMRGENIQGEFTMALLEIPSEVQSLLSLFRDKVAIYIKEHKVVFQAEDLYMVFGR